MHNIYLVKIRNFTDIHQIDDTEVLHLLRHREEGLVHHHTGGVPVMTESDEDHTVLLR